MTQTEVHPTAIVEDGAELGDGVRIGPFTHIGPKVRIGANTEVMSHVAITGRTTIGANVRIFPAVVLGCEPQNVKYNGEDTQLIIGTGCVIREGVTMHTGMADAGGKTTIGDHSLFLAYSHVAHDCHVGDHVILSNNVMLAGHVTVGDHVIMGGGAAAHQFSRIGHRAFIAGMTGVTHDVIPYGMAIGAPAALDGLNVIGMNRAGMDKEKVHEVRRAFKAIFEDAESIREAAQAYRAKAGDNKAIVEIIDFIGENRERALTVPSRLSRR